MNIYKINISYREVIGYRFVEYVWFESFREFILRCACVNISYSL